MVPLKFRKIAIKIKTIISGLVVISIVGNTLALHTLLRKRMRRKRSAILFLNLSMADCLVTIFPMAGNIVQAA